MITPSRHCCSRHRHHQEFYFIPAMVMDVFGEGKDDKPFVGGEDKVATPSRRLGVRGGAISLMR